MNGLDSSQAAQMLFPEASNPVPDPQWDLVSLGLEEPLPAQDAIDELYVRLVINLPRSKC